MDKLVEFFKSLDLLDIFDRISKCQYNYKNNIYFIDFLIFCIPLSAFVFFNISLYADLFSIEDTKLPRVYIAIYFFTSSSALLLYSASVTIHYNTSSTRIRNFIAVFLNILLTANIIMLVDSILYRYDLGIRFLVKQNRDSSSNPLWVDYTWITIYFAIVLGLYVTRSVEFKNLWVRVFRVQAGDSPLDSGSTSFSTKILMFYFWFYGSASIFGSLILWILVQRAEDLGGVSGVIDAFFQFSKITPSIQK